MSADFILPLRNYSHHGQCQDGAAIGEGGSGRGRTLSLPWASGSPCGTAPHTSRRAFTVRVPTGSPKTRRNHITAHLPSPAHSASSRLPGVHTCCELPAPVSQGDYVLTARCSRRPRGSVLGSVFVPLRCLSLGSLIPPTLGHHPWVQ